MLIKSKSILEQVNFEGIYTEVPEIAGSHHEKLDGTGYPNGLTGDKIHFGAKIISVADVFEALTSKRHYRDPMPVNDAFNYLLENIEIQFDKQCVEAFINFYNKNLLDNLYIPKGVINFKNINNYFFGLIPLQRIIGVYVNLLGFLKDSSASLINSLYPSL